MVALGFVKRAYDISRKKVYFCEHNDKLADVAWKMHTNNIGSIIVRKNDKPVGIITVNELLRQMSSNQDPVKTNASQIMSSPIITASQNLEIDELVDAFNKHKVSRMVLTNDRSDIVAIVRDIAVFKYMTFYKYDRDVKKRWAQSYMNKLY